jgi:hypothetical protein
MRRLYTAADLPEAHLVRQLLAQAGIEALVFNEYAQGALGEIPFGHAYPEVWLLDERDEPRARAIVDAYARRRPRTETRTCAGCGEENPAEFELCWRCGAPLVP